MDSASASGLCVALAICCVSLPCAAQSDTMARIRGGGAAPPVEAPPALPEWRAPYDAGLRAFEAGQYEDALQGFTRGYELGGPASLAYDMAICLDRLGRGREAIDGYRRYLTLVPDAANREAVEDRMDALSGSSSRLPSALGRPDAPPLMTPIEHPPDPAILVPVIPPPAASPAPSGSPGPEWAVSWVFLGVTALSAASAAIAGAVGEAQFNDLRAYCTAIMGCAEDVIASDVSHTSETAANVLWVTTGILGGTTIAAFVIEGLVSANPPRRMFIDRARIELRVTPWSLAIGGTF